MILKYSTIMFLVLLLTTKHSNSQSWDNGMSFQGALKNNSTFFNNESINLRFTIKDSSAIVLWQETQTTTTNNTGIINTIIGAGVSTGLGLYSTFPTIDFSTKPTTLLVEIDPDGSGYIPFQEGSLWAVPFAEHSQYNEKGKELNTSLVDVNNGGLDTNHVVTWNGVNWNMASLKNELNADFSLTTDSAVTSDSSVFSFNSNASSFADTALFSEFSDSTDYALNSILANISETTMASDTTNLAFFNSSHSLSGSHFINSNYLGSNNLPDLSFFTNNLNRLTLTNSSSFLQGTTESIHSLYLNGQEGFQIKGILDSGLFKNLSLGNHFYYSPKHSSMWLGTAVDTLWHADNAGNYNLAAGRNCWSNGVFSAAFGDSCFVEPITGAPLSPGVGSLAIGSRSSANGAYSFACGFGCSAKITRSVAIGYKSSAPYGYSSIAIGHTAVADGNNTPCVAIGHNINNDGKNSFAFGHNIDLNFRFGTFIYADYSTADTLQPPTNDHYQFIARAAGGVTFFSDSGITNGVQLFSGSGAWSSVSDSSKKENIISLEKHGIINHLKNLNTYTWNYKSQNDNAVHIGPMAQDFSAAFNCGQNNTSISTIDSDGIVLHAIQELDSKLDQIHSEFNSANHLSELEYTDVNNKLEKVEALIKLLNSE